MKRKIIWLVVSCLMVAALVLASCGPAEVEEEVVVEEEEVVVEEEEVVVEEEEELVVEEEEVVVEEEVAPAPEEPRYGGVFISGQSSAPRTFDNCFGWPTVASTSLTNEELMGMDYRKGPSGTGEVSFMYFTFMTPDIMKPLLAESWEMPDANTLVFKIRKGVHWHDKPPANGREMTADDVVFSLVRLWDTEKCPKAPQAAYYGWDKYMESVTATDEWTVVVKSKPGELGQVWEMVSDTSKIYPRDAVEQYGDLNDWENVCGTGPFMFENYIKDSAWTLERNPNYWDTDPDRPENQLPYLDGIKGIVMPDMSTRMAALRTAKIDYLYGVPWEDAERFMERQPELKYVRYLNTPPMVAGRIDKPELPFYDKRVRQALALAINNQEIADTYYGGHAEVFSWPGAPIPELRETFTPLEEMPESVQELYGYNPDKAKQLLADAGYPDGFKTEILCASTSVDILSVVKAYWAAIGVELKLDVKEAAIRTVVGYKKSHKEMIYAGLAGWTPWALGEVRTGHTSNYAMVNDQRVDEAFDKIMSSEVFFEFDKRVEVLNTVKTYIAEQNWFTLLPASYSYTFWYPWVKNYSGEYRVGFLDWDFPRWIWLDQDLKEEMTGKR